MKNVNFHYTLLSVQSHHRHQEEYGGQHLTGWQPGAGGAALFRAHSVTPRDKQLPVNAPVERHRSACPQVQPVSPAAAEAPVRIRYADVVEAAALTPRGCLFLR